ncbi:uncharacterized protein LOC130998152 [Salvia miltiorrhiza]|uniref:uncharacterized protein LOC130998152 n=1 Tax=Salvia miltiorrhiza TaxID=226208 RepID=UPI0025ACF645|nr:uncharacterized protein LOC130998152 [Salvia miltiorrhiza]
MLSRLLPITAYGAGFGVWKSYLKLNFSCASETIEHALKDFKWTAFLWKAPPLRLAPIDEQDLCDLSFWFDKIRLSPHRESHGMFATIAWSVWYARNLLLFQDKELSHMDCLNITQRAMWNKNTSLERAHADPSPTSFRCSRRGQVKIWCDAAIYILVGMGFGAILKDGDGNLLGSCYGFIPGVFDVVEAEAKTVLDGCRFCVENNLGDVIIKTDSQILY